MQETFIAYIIWTLTGQRQALVAFGQGAVQFCQHSDEPRPGLAIVVVPSTGTPSACETRAFRVVKAASKRYPKASLNVILYVGSADAEEF